MIIDFHTHVFPDKVAAKALPKLAAGSGGMEPVYDATVDGLESFLSKKGIDKAVAPVSYTHLTERLSVRYSNSSGFSRPYRSIITGEIS